MVIECDTWPLGLHTRIVHALNPSQQSDQVPSQGAFARLGVHHHRDWHAKCLLNRSTHILLEPLPRAVVADTAPHCATQPGHCCLREAECHIYRLFPVWDSRRVSRFTFQQACLPCLSRVRLLLSRLGAVQRVSSHTLQLVPRRHCHGWPSVRMAFDNTWKPQGIHAC